MIKIIILTTSVAFPNGMAPAQRVKLFARIFTEANFDVTVLCTQVTERKTKIKNYSPNGFFYGIPFEYTTGTPIRSDNFFIRRFIEIKGIFIAICRIFEARKKFSKFVIYHYGNNLENEFSKWIYYCVANLLRIPVILDLREMPWTLVNSKRKALFNMSPLSGVKGVIAISDYLSNWSKKEAARLHKEIKIINIPILVDISESITKSNFAESKNVLFAGSSEYDSTVSFIIESMKEVWKVHTDCKLIITGYDPSSLGVRKITNNLIGTDAYKLIEFPGYLSREELFNMYEQSSGLLIPLFDDIRSIARFPTKIGEYLASGRPIVTTNVGEIPKYFIDGKNSLICEPGSPTLFCDKIIFLLANTNEANQIGISGRKTALKYFYYKNYISILSQFINSFFELC
jgi:glycosyltransferase involved in cell wall biosynthesis